MALYNSMSVTFLIIAVSELFIYLSSLMTGNSSNSVAAPIFDEEIGAEEATMKEVGDCEIDAVAGLIVVLSAFASPGGVFRSSKARSGVRASEKVVVMIFSNITVLVVVAVISLVGTEVVEGVVGAIDV